MADYPRYILNFINASDPANGIPDKNAAPTADPSTAAIIEQQARRLISSGTGTVVIINGSHTQLLRAGAAQMDMFLSHQDEANDRFPTINVVYREP